MNALTKLAASLIVGASTLALPAQGAEYEFKFAHILPPVHLLAKDLFPDWAKRIETQSGGRIKMTQYPSGQLLKANETYDGIRSRVAEMGFVMTNTMPGRFPVTSITELPFLFRTAEAGSRAMMDLYESGAMEKEFADIKVLYLHALDISTIHTRDTPLNQPSALNGLRIRFPSVPVKDLLAAYGANPIGVPTQQIYENLERGVVDGYTGGWDSIISLRTGELVRHHLDMPVYTLPFCICMNKAVFEKLPADLQKVIMDNSGPEEAARVGAAYDRASREGYEYLIKEGHNIHKPTAEQEAQWRAGAKPVIDAHLKALETKGIKKAREYYELLKTAAAKYEAQ